MSIGRFNETGESSSDVNENNESNLDNQDSPRNQILETPDDYSDNFDEKCSEGEDSSDIDENNETDDKDLEDPESTDDFDKKLEDSDNKEDFDNQENSGKESPWDKFKSFFSKEGSDTQEETEPTENTESAADRAKDFRESLKPENFESQMDEPPENVDTNNVSESEEDPHEEPQRERSLFD